MGTATKKKRKPLGALKRLAAHERAKLRKGLPAPLSKAEVNEYVERWTKPNLRTPKRLLILRSLILEAWNFVCYARDAGLELRSSSLEQAALTIAGCAFAGWRGAQPDNPDLQEEAETEIVRGFAAGILWVISRGDGMPSGMANVYTFHASRGESVLDRMIPLQLVEKLFPDMVKDGELTLPYYEPPGEDEACQWWPVPNILTTSIEEVNAAERLEELRDIGPQKKSKAKKSKAKKSKAKKSKAKPRAK